MQIAQDAAAANGTIYQIFNMINWMQDQQEIDALVGKVKETMALNVDSIEKSLSSGRLSEGEKKLYEAVLSNLLEYQKASTRLLELALSDATSSFQTVSAGMEADKKYATLHKNLSALVDYEKKLGNILMIRPSLLFICWPPLSWFSSWP